MTTTQVLQQLKAAGTAQNRKIYARHGVETQMFGVSYAHLGKLRRSLKVNHQLALGLWATGNHDARVLATMIADPGQADGVLLEAWATECGDCCLAGGLGKFARHTAFAEAKAEKWCQHPREIVAVVGWVLVAELALNSRTTDPWFAAWIKTIEREIHQAPNHVRSSMNGALIAIGGRNARLEKLAVAAAKRIGKVEVDHGETGCKTPDAVTYIAKMKAHRAKKAGRA